MIGALGATGHPVAGRYVLVDPIGSGAMGSIWRAYDLRTQSWTAAKVLAQHDSGLLLRFVREQGVRIPHPHVVAPTGWAAEENVVVFTMDLVRGGSLQQLLDECGPLPVEYAATLLDQLLDALTAVHAAGVVHRDVKPANLLLEPTGTDRPHLRLGDFGVAALDDSVRLTRAPGLVGTEGYAAPEQLHGAAPDPRQDLYAAGRVARQLLPGTPPGPLMSLVNDLLAVDPDGRPPSAALARDRLRHCGLAPWRGPHPDGPCVPDRLGEARIPVAGTLALPADPGSARPRTPTSVWVAIGCFTGALGLCAAAAARLPWLTWLST